MSADKISSLFDVENISSEIKTVAEGVTGLKEQFLQFGKVINDYKGAKGMTEQKQATDDLVKSTNEVTASIKEFQRIQAQTIATQAKINAVDTEANKTLIEKKEALKQATKELIAQTDAYKQLELQAAKADQVAKQSGARAALNPGNSDFAKQAAEDAVAANNFKNQLKAIDDSIGNHQRHVGDYVGALKTLKQEQQAVVTKMQALKEAGQQNGTTYTLLASQHTTLTGIINREEAGFTSLAREIRAGREGLESMVAAGLKGTPAFNELEKKVQDSTRALNHMRKEQTLLSSEAPTLNSLTIAAKGLAGAYALGAGAAALFGDEEGKIDKEVQKLVAIMTVLQGLQEVHQLLLERNAIATALNNSLMRIYTFVVGESTGALKAFRIALASAFGVGIFIALYELYTHWDSIKNAITGTTKEQELFNKVNAKAAEQVGEEVAKLELFKNKLSDTNLKHSERVKLVNEYNDIAAKTNQIEGKEIDNLTIINKKIDEQIKLIEKQAVAKAAEAELAKQSTEYVKAQLALDDAVSKSGLSEIQLQEKVNSLMKQRGALIEKSSGKRPSIELQKEIDSVDEQLRKITGGVLAAGISQLFAERDAAKKELDDKVASLAPLITTLDNGKDNSKEAASSGLADEFRKKELESAAKQARDLLLIQQALFKAEADNQENSLEKRLTASKLYAEKSREIIKRQKEDEEKILKQEVEVATKKANEIKDAKEKADALVAIKAYQKTKEKEIVAAGDKSEADLEQSLYKQNLQIAQESIEKLEKLRKESFERIKKQAEVALKNESDQVQITKNEKLLKLDKDFNDGKINNIEQYEKRKKEIEENAALEDEKLQFKRYKTAEAILELQGYKNFEFLKKIKELEVKIEDDAAAKKIKKWKDLEAQKKQIAEESFDLIKTLVDAGFENELNAIQKQIDANNKQKEQESKNISESTVSAQEKAALQIELDRKVANENEILARKQRDIKIKEAKFDRDAAVLKIIGETLSAAAKEEWITPAAIAIQIIGALQVATLLAKPLPSYQKGTDASPEGFAKVHTGEMIIDPSGSTRMTPPGETIQYLKRGSKVIPQDEVNRMMLQGMMRNTAASLEPSGNNQKLDEIRTAIIQGSQIQASAIKKIRQTTNINMDSGFYAYITKAVKE